MKLIIGIFVSYLVAFGMAQRAPSQEEIIRESTGKCAEELEITLDESFLKPEPNEDEKHKKFIACFLTKIGAVSLDGMILGSKLLEFMDDGDVSADLKSTIEKCAIVEGDSLKDRAYSFYKCVWIERIAAEL